MIHEHADRSVTAFPAALFGDQARVRRHPDSAQELSRPRSGWRQTPESLALAEAMLWCDPRSHADDYLGAFSAVPTAHLETLRARGVIIILAPTVPEGMLSSEIERRRGSPFSISEMQAAESDYGESTGVAAVYHFNPEALIFPTDYAPADLERFVLHEVGHALTLQHASPTAGNRLLAGLPTRIYRHVSNPQYDSDEHDAEILAEGYVDLVVGNDVDAGLASRLHGILASHGQPWATRRTRASKGRQGQRAFRPNRSAGSARAPREAKHCLVGR